MNELGRSSEQSGKSEKRGYSQGFSELLFVGSLSAVFWMLSLIGVFQFKLLDLSSDWVLWGPTLASVVFFIVILKSGKFSKGSGWLYLFEGLFGLAVIFWGVFTCKTGFNIDTGGSSNWGGGYAAIFYIISGAVISFVGILAVMAALLGHSSLPVHKK